MPKDRKDKEAQDEEFEPLDRFFAPIEDVDWPEDGDEGEDAATPAAPEEEILPPGIPEDPLAGVEAEAEAPMGGAPQEAPGATVESTAELSGEGWEELRLEMGSGAQGGDEPTEAGGAFADPDDGRELSLEDLTAAPAEYENLPGPAEDGVPSTTDTPAEHLTANTPSEGGEPPLEEVEAAADHFAESFREDAPASQGSGGLPPPDEVEQDLLSDLGKEPPEPASVGVGVTDTLTGPSWQEPGSQEVSVTPASPRGGRNLPLALLSGIVLVVIGIGAAALGKGPFTVVAGAVIVMAQGELYAALHRKGYQPATALGLVFGGLISAAAYLRGEAGILAMFALGTVFTFLWFMAIPAKSRHNTLANVAATVLPIAYVPVLGGFLMTILALPGGTSLSLAVIGLTVGYDVAAYAMGSLWGHRALAPSISPRKSWEGAILATLIILLASLLVLPSLDTFTALAPGNGYGPAIGLGVLIAIFAPLGDLAESMMKRDLGVKDMSSVIPGHGGVLDRIDSLLFAVPAAFYFFRLILF